MDRDRFGFAERVIARVLGIVEVADDDTTLVGLGVGDEELKDAVLGLRAGEGAKREGERDPRGARDFQTNWYEKAAIGLHLILSTQRGFDMSPIAKGGSQWRIVE